MKIPLLKTLFISSALFLCLNNNALSQDNKKLENQAKKQFKNKSKGIYKPQSYTQKKYDYHNIEQAFDSLFKQNDIIFFGEAHESFEEFPLMMEEFFDGKNIFDYAKEKGVTYLFIEKERPKTINPIMARYGDKTPSPLTVTGTQAAVQNYCSGTYDSADIAVINRAADNPLGSDLNIENLFHIYNNQDSLKLNDRQKKNIETAILLLEVMTFTPDLNTLFLKQACDSGLKIVPIDSDRGKLNTMSSKEYDHERSVRVNDDWANYIDEMLQNKEKAIVYCGRGHVGGNNMINLSKDFLNEHAYPVNTRLAEKGYQVATIDLFIDATQYNVFESNKTGLFINTTGLGSDYELWTGNFVYGTKKSTPPSIDKILDSMDTFLNGLKDDIQELAQIALDYPGANKPPSPSNKHKP